MFLHFMTFNDSCSENAPETPPRCLGALVTTISRIRQYVISLHAQENSSWVLLSRLMPMVGPALEVEGSSATTGTGQYVGEYMELGGESGEDPQPPLRKKRDFGAIQLTIWPISHPPQTAWFPRT